jgi:hypothetical protein
MHIYNATPDTFKQLYGQFGDKMTDCRSLEEAAQTFVNLLFEHFEESVVLLRLFITLPFGTLSEKLQRSARHFAEERDRNITLPSMAPVMTLMGIRGGVEIRNSRQCFGIPLLSPEMIESIPLLAELLKELEFTFDWENAGPNMIRDEQVETSSVGPMTGVLYVPDAQKAVNVKGEKILSVIDYLTAHSMDQLAEIQTIFGVGGRYINGSFMSLVMFSPEALEMHTVERCMPLANYFKTSTFSLLVNGHMFSL